MILTIMMMMMMIVFQNLSSRFSKPQNNTHYRENISITMSFGSLMEGHAKNYISDFFFKKNDVEEEQL